MLYLRSTALIASCALALGGCTTFATVRSAEVRLGPSVAVHQSVSTPPGADAGWFWIWSLDCNAPCDGPVVGGDVGITYGLERDRLGRPVAVSVGTSGVHPYLDGYVQLSEGRRPFGIGARVGPPITSWREHQLCARYDVPLGTATRLLLNPSIFLHEGRSPNGENPGHFLGLVQGIGLHVEGERLSWTPAVAVIAGRANRTSYGQEYGPTSSVFMTASLGITWHRPRTLAR